MVLGDSFMVLFREEVVWVLWLYMGYVFVEGLVFSRVFMGLRFVCGYRRQYDRGSIIVFGYSGEVVFSGRLFRLVIRTEKSFVFGRVFYSQVKFVGLIRVACLLIGQKSGLGFFCLNSLWVGAFRRIVVGLVWQNLRFVLFFIVSLVRS